MKMKTKMLWFLAVYCCGLFTAATSSLTLQLNSTVVRMTKNQPFIVTCAIVNFPIQGFSYYQVEFRENKHSLGTYTFDQHNKDYQKLYIEYAPSSAIADVAISGASWSEREHTFWMSITGNSPTNAEYWCTFKSSPSGQVIAQSNKWNSNSSFDTNMPSMVWIVFAVVISMKCKDILNY